MANAHTFHIPVMGIGFTIDTALKVSQYGIDSVISLIDDSLIERLREMYCKKNNIEYVKISQKDEDCRAKRISSYLNLINKLATEKFENLKNAAIDKSNELKEYFNFLPDGSELKEKFNNLMKNGINIKEIRQWLSDNLMMGSINVNIMTKVDRVNYRNGEKLDNIFNDAHAALRGFAESDLESSVIFSAGMNPRLYQYLTEFDDFFPDSNGKIRKKIVLKVSDYRSALIQGKFLAKKGLWVSEYRIESGLNCGGHAFATSGQLLGPILEQFKNNRQELLDSTRDILTSALKKLNKTIPDSLTFRVTAQGGVGTSEEHDFLLNHYKIDSVGWGSLFLLVPEVTNVDDNTLQMIMDSKEDDLYLSNISPLGIPFNNLRQNTKDTEKRELIESGKPGSLCPKKYAALNQDYNDKGLCTASYKYQKAKIDELDHSRLNGNYSKEYEKIVEKSCICVGLGTSALLVNGLDTKNEGEGVSVCPGPNIAYYSRRMTLSEIIDHIYGRKSFLTHTDRPNFLIKELSLYINNLKSKISESNKSEENLITIKNFGESIIEGIDYYNKLFNELNDYFKESKKNILSKLEEYKIEVENMLMQSRLINQD